MEVITIESKAYNDIMKRLDANRKEDFFESKAFNDILKRIEVINKDITAIQSKVFSVSKKTLQSIIYQKEGIKKGDELF